MNTLTEHEVKFKTPDLRQTEPGDKFKLYIKLMYSFTPPALRYGRYGYSPNYPITFPAYSATGCLFNLILFLF